jgi:REP element-mobilizing transposase RayT
MSFFDPNSAVTKQRRELPHWVQDEKIYFVTFRLFDSLPVAKREEIENEKELWHRLNPEPLSSFQQSDYARRFTQKINRWLDSGYGVCFLRNRAVRDSVTRTLTFFNGSRYRLGEFTIMPNHLHVLVTPLGEYQLRFILHSWKSYSAKQINRILGRSGQVWQHESFDHLVRNAVQLDRIEEYIRNNLKIGRRKGTERIDIDF